MVVNGKIGRIFYGREKIRKRQDLENSAKTLTTHWHCRGCRHSTDDSNIDWQGEKPVLAWF
jgi:hypothetical protein